MILALNTGLSPNTISSTVVSWYEHVSATRFMMSFVSLVSMTCGLSSFMLFLPSSPFKKSLAMVRAYLACRTPASSRLALHAASLSSASFFFFAKSPM